MSQSVPWDVEIAFNAGFDFFEGPQFDGHLQDDGVGEDFHTKFGVTQMTYKAALADGVVTLPWEQVTSKEDMRSIYRKYFYDDVQCPLMPPAVAMVVFVDATLMGPTQPRLHMQEALNVVEDDIFGVKTKAALLACDPKAVALKIDELDLIYLKALGAWAVDGRGWVKREEQLAAQAILLPMQQAPTVPTV
jgi:lysozyme family protein